MMIFRFSKRIVISKVVFVERNRNERENDKNEKCMFRSNVGESNRRQESEMYRKREELKRLKKLREQEIEKKLKEIEAIAGMLINSRLEHQLGTNVDIDIDSDFDPEKYDKQMEAMYNDDYYNQGISKYSYNEDLNRGIGEA